MENLSAEVERVFMDCLFTPEEIAELGEERLKELCIPAEGIVTTVGFNPYRLGTHALEIRDFVNEMAPEFFEETGGGWTFLNLCHDRHGKQWTDLHQRMEQLLQLAIATQMANYCLPRKMWDVLPGGMPYVVFKRRKTEPVDV